MTVRKTVRNVIVAAGAVPAAVALGGCGTAVIVNPGQTVAGALYKTVGQHPKSVACPQGIESKVGAAFRCTVTANDGSKIGVTVTVTSVQNGKPQLNIHVDSTAG